LARQHQASTPYIFFSGTIGEENAVKALQRGASDYVIKDRPGRLVPAIRQALERVKNADSKAKVEEDLRESQDRYRQITENVADLIAVVDLAGRCVYNNQAYSNVLGEPESLRGTDSFGSIHPDDRTRMRKMFTETIRSGIAWNADHRFLLPRGAIRYIESRGSVLRDADGQAANVLIVSRDVTERRASELQLRKQASLLDRASDAIIATDLEHRVTYWNSSAERIYGWTASEVAGRDLREIGLAYDSGKFALASTQLAFKGEWRGNFWLRTRDGNMLQIEATWSLVLSSGGDSDSVLMIDTDVTEKIKLENQLLRADRMDRIGMLAGGVAHDLNNALAPIIMGAELLLQNPTDSRNIRIILNIERSVQHGAALVRQLLAFARGGDGEYAEVRVDALMEDAKQLLGQSLPRNISLKVECIRPLWPIYADATQIKQVLMNLCINARDALPNGGCLEIKAENMTVSADLARLHPGARQGSHVRISVWDNGTGIPPEILEKIFDPFFTTKAIGKGTGLGLSMVVGIVKKHSGFLTVESSVGRGTVFQLNFPAMLQSQLPSTKSRDPYNGEKCRERILLIDDDSQVRDTYRLVLEREGYQVATASDGSAGLAEFGKEGEPASVVIVDMRMPGMDSMEVIAAIRARKHGQPIVAISGFTDPKLSAELAALNPSIECLAKPIAVDDLLGALRQMIEAAGP
jgi:PAS domain S-box-containing protein